MKPVKISPNNLEIIDAVKRAAASYHRVSVDDLVHSKERHLIMSRYICFYIIKEMAYSLYDYEIGYFFDKKRSVVMYGIDLVRAHMKIYRQVIGELNEIVDIANTFEKKYSWHIPKTISQD